MRIFPHYAQEEEDLLMDAFHDITREYVYTNPNEIPESHLEEIREMARAIGITPQYTDGVPDSFKQRPRMYRVPKDQVDRLPVGESGPFLPYNKTHGFYVYDQYHHNDEDNREWTSI